MFSGHYRTWSFDAVVLQRKETKGIKNYDACAQKLFLLNLCLALFMLPSSDGVREF